MRRMHACATVSSVVLGLVLAAATFVACGNAGPPPQPPTSSGGATTPAAPLPMASGDIGFPSDAPAHAAKSQQPTKPPDSVADCNNMPPEQLQSDITNEPDGGTCMNNAMTSADAGSSDRCLGMTSSIRARRNAYRCCYDLYSRTNKNPGAHIVLHVELGIDGAVTDASLNKERSSLSPPEIEACMAGITKTLAFPKSPGGKTTKFNYPFDFKAHF
jgi:hypothetical protein